MSLIKSIQLIGHACHDRAPDGYLLGGTVSYAATMAAHLVEEVRLLTSYGADFLYADHFQQLGVRVQNIASEQTTIFENIYESDNRIQYLHQKAQNLHIDGSLTLEPASIYMFCPIADEVVMDNAYLSRLKGTKGATIQGWLRTVDANNKVISKLPTLRQFESMDIIVMSDEDIRDSTLQIEHFIDLVPVVVLTHGPDGATIYKDKRKHFFPSFQTDPEELTGAGDIFSTAFICVYSIRQDLAAAASFAHAAASLNIEGTGMSAVPNLERISERQELYLNRYL